MLNPKQKILLHKIKTIGFDRISNYFDAFLFLIRLPAIEKFNLTNVLLFTGEQLPPRIPRMAKWIKRQSDYSVVLVCHQNGYVPEFSDNCFDAIYLFRNEWHLKRILKQLKNIQLVHGFAPKSKFPNSVRKYLSKPYIHDMQDVYTVYYAANNNLGWLNKELPHEHECLSNATGIISHSMEVNPALRIIKPIKKPKTLFFPLYCDSDFFIKKIPASVTNDIHIVYAGGVAGSHRNYKQYGNIQFHKLIAQLSAQQLHFHIYPSPSNLPADYLEYEDIAKSNPYFHLHKPISQQKLASELSKYDFGILPFFKELSEQSELKLKYATTLKLFNYLEAGIPIIVSKDIYFQQWLVNRYSCGVIIKRDELPLLKQKLIAFKAEKNSSKNTIESAREHLSISENLSRLLNFYTEITKIA